MFLIKFRFFGFLVVIISIFTQSVFASSDIGNKKANSFAQKYVELAKTHQTLYITPDLAFEQVHFWYAKSLKSAEKKLFLPALTNLFNQLIVATEKDLQSETDPAVKEILQKNLEYLQVGERLAGATKRDLSTEINRVDAEIKLIESAEGLNTSPVMGYQEDYTQYKPRGHYTQDAELTKYFKLAIWLGRIGFFSEPNTVAGIDEKLAKRLTTQSVFLALILSKNPQLQTELKQIEENFRLWFGESDDLTFSELTAILQKHFDSFATTNYPQIIEKAETIRQSLYQTARRPQIASGVNLEGSQPPLSVRLVGQRFMFDSYVFNQLTFGRVKDYHGNKDDIFTLSITPQGRKVRGLPTVFDLMTVYGSSRALEIIKSNDNHNYQGYAESLQKLQEVKPLSTANFIELYHLAIKKNLAMKDDRLSLQNENLALNSSIGAYILLRHDLAAYSKQSYTSTPRGMASEPQITEKPNFIVANSPETFKILAEAVEKLTQNISAVSTENSSESNTLLVFLKLSELNAGKEIVNKKDSETLWQFIETSAQKSEKVMLITDVHTDLISKQVLQIGVGYPQTIKISADSKEPPIVGAVFQNYQFKQKMENRLTNVVWINNLNNPQKESDLNLTNTIENRKNK